MRCCVVVLLSTLAIGCTKDEPIRVYDAPRAVEPSYTIRGAMFPVDDPVWIFKVSGPTDMLGVHMAALDKFFASVRFPNGPGNPPIWDVPAGWTLAGDDGQFAQERFRFGDEAKPFTMTFGKFRGGFDENLGRWVGQAGLVYKPAEREKYARPLGTPPVGWVIAVTGPKNPISRGMMPGR
jgi:hypothetical protein